MAALLTRLLSLPFTLFSLVLSRIFRIRAPFRLSWSGVGVSSASSSSNSNDDGFIVDPSAAAEHFVRSLNTYADDGDVSPAMWSKGGYNAALRLAKEDCKILLVVLTSREHEDHLAFMRLTLCTNAFRTLLQEHSTSIMLWGGDVCISRDAQIASTVLQATTYPFLAFLSMQPLPSWHGTSSSSSNSKMSVFSRLEGMQSTSLPHLRSHISETVLPRLGGYLSRLQAQKRERGLQRTLREEQDRAYSEAGKRDFARVQAKEAELRSKKLEEQKKAEAEARKETERKSKEREQRNREHWRKNTAASFGREPEQGGPRLVVRLPDGRRMVRRFAEQEGAKRIWEWIECEAHGYPVAVDDVFTSRAQNVTSYQPGLTFSFATTFPPRRTIEFEHVHSKTVGQLVNDGVLDKQVANLLVEGLTIPGSAAQAEDEEEEEEEED